MSESAQGGERLKPAVAHPRCPYCHDEVSPSDEKVACASCMGWQHPECWEGHGACGAWGSVQALRSETSNREDQVPWYRRPAARADWTLGATGIFFIATGLPLLDHHSGPWLGLLVVATGLFALLTGIRVWRQALRLARESGSDERGSSSLG